ncbi:MAG: lytic transglycosylase domain-containing protein [Treponema sp.]|nr:lytic transglycosylase domain-containing protein [Treponema sp.]
MEMIIPMFTGVLLSMFLCAIISVDSGIFSKPPESKDSIIVIEDDNQNFLSIERGSKPDSVLEYFRNPEYREWVINFFAGITSNREIARIILENAEKFNVPPALAFALCWEESRFNPRAVSRFNYDGSIDRGLFQLNNRSFPFLELYSFFDVSTNVYYGMGHLKHCLDSGRSEISALAIYNAGAGRVRNTGAPEVTLNYISRILDNKSKIESRFHVRLQNEEEARIAAKSETPNTLYFSRTLNVRWNAR